MHPRPIPATSADSRRMGDELYRIFTRLIFSEIFSKELIEDLLSIQLAFSGYKYKLLVFNSLYMHLMSVSATPISLLPALTRVISSVIMTEVILGSSYNGIKDNPGPSLQGIAVSRGNTIPRLSLLHRMSLILETALYGPHTDPARAHENSALQSRQRRHP